MPESSDASATCEPPRWRLSGMQATDEIAQARVNLAEPRLGLAVPDGDAEMRLLGLELPEGCRPTEVWSRGADLTAVYEPGDGRQLRVTAMWRAAVADEQLPGVRSWQMVLSAQTSRLSSLAELSVRSQRVGEVAEGCWHEGRVDWQHAAAGEVTCLRMCGPAAEGSGSCLVIAIHPDDAGVVEHDDGEADARLVRCRLFPRDVEKGVLLRSRVLVAVGPRESLKAAEGWPDAVLRKFAGSEPILST